MHSLFFDNLRFLFAKKPLRSTLEQLRFETDDEDSKAGCGLTVEFCDEKKFGIVFCVFFK